MLECGTEVLRCDVTGDSLRCAGLEALVPCLMWDSGCRNVSTRL